MIRKGFILHSPIIVLTTTWIVTFFLYFLNPFKLDGISAYTWWIIILGLTSIYLGFFTANILGGGFKLREVHNERYHLPFSTKRIVFFILIMSTLGLIGRFGTTYLIYKEIGNIGIYLIDAQYVRNFLKDTMLGNTDVNMLYYKLFSYMGSFSTVTVIMAGAISHTKTSRLVIIFPLLVAAFHSVTTLQRVYFVKHYVMFLATAFIIIYYYPTSEQKQALRKFFKQIIYFLIITSIFVVMVIVLRHLLDPGSQLNKVLNSFYFYIAGNLHWLDKYLVNDPEPLYGTSIFRSFISWFSRLGLIDKSSIIAPHYEFYKLYDIMGNTFTYLRIPYEDFNIIGVAVFSYAWGWSSLYTIRKYLSGFSMVRLYLSALFIYSFFWSFFGFGMTAITTIIWKSFLFIISGKIVLESKK